MPERVQTRAEMAAPVQTTRKSATTARVRGKRFVEHYALPPDWWQISGVLLAAALALFAFERSMPSVFSGLLWFAGIIGCLISFKTAEYERKEQLGAQESHQLVAASVAAPMVLFGAGMGLWHLPQAEGSHVVMAQLLCISVKTVMGHRTNVMEKLDVHNQTELVRFALGHGLIRVD